MRTTLFACALAISAVAGCSKGDQAKTEQKDEQKLATMTMDEVEAAITSGQAIAVDCNGDRTRKKDGILPGAIMVTDEEQYGASELPADKSRKLIFYCADPG
jgi:phosphoribosylformylglycinamidine (FGAM) synthase-like amidotransferase family enzyme